VHGSIADHNTFDSLNFALAPDVTVSAMDRRGCGGSPDTPGHSTDREFADVALVVDT
jgi:pimeloyl-ACP methyl ester carboxylesterase